MCTKAAASTAAADDTKLAHAVTGVTVAAIQGLDVQYLTRLCKHHHLDLAKHWKLCKEFLELITKSEMMVVADELGIRAALGDNFKKVFGKSKVRSHRRASGGRWLRLHGQDPEGAQVLIARPVASCIDRSFHPL